MKKSTVVIFNQLNIKNNKNDKDSLKKNIRKKSIWENTVAINDVLKKTIQYWKNKFDKDNLKKKHVGEVKAKFSTN